MRIYTASSWRNPIYPPLPILLRQSGYEVYDFRNPEGAADGFHWTDIDQEWRQWTPRQFARGLQSPRAIEGFSFDYNALRRADVLVLVLPCGRSAHLEMGFTLGQGKPAFILYPDNPQEHHCEGELMYKMATQLCFSTGELLDALSGCAQ